MFPTVVGIVPDTMYCDCWQTKLAEMIGPYRRRHSRLVTFLDPEDVDVNFVPNDAWDEIHVLGGRFKYIYFFIFTPKVGEIIQFDEHIFQMGWFNHQLVLFFVKCKEKRRIGWFGEGDKDDLVKMGLLSLVVGFVLTEERT